MRSGPLAEPPSTLLSKPGRSRRRAHRRGRGQSQGSEVAAAKRSVSPASAGVGDRRGGKRLREANWLAPGTGFFAALRTTPFFLPPQPRLRRFRSAAGAGPRQGQGCEWAAPGG